MVRRVKDHTGEVHGRLTVTGQYFKETGSKGKRKKYFTVECSCGTIKDVRADGILSGQVVSCGCYHSEISKEIHAKHLRPTMFTSESLKTHGMTGTTEHRIWRAMRQRCNNPNHSAYHHYGGRGIKVCKRWDESFEAFYADMGPRPEGCDIDRIDNSLGYSKQNCKWRSHRENCNNRRDTITVLYNGSMTTLSYLAEELGMEYHTLYNRLYYQAKLGHLEWNGIKWKDGFFANPYEPKSEGSRWKEGRKERER